LCQGVVPMVEYKTYTFQIIAGTPTISELPKGVYISQITKTTIRLLDDFLVKIKEMPKFDTICIIDINVLSNLIQNSQLYVYCLKYVENQILGYYFFRNANIQYEDMVTGAEDCDTLQFVGSFNNTTDCDVFYGGFLHIFQDIIKKHRPYKVLQMDGISHNANILEKWTEHVSVELEHKCAYYLYNFVWSVTPINPERVFIL